MAEEIPKREVEVKVSCPFCPESTVHSYPITVNYSLVMFAEPPGDWPETSKPFTRIFVCPASEKSFEAELTVSQDIGEIVEGDLTDL